MLARVAERVYWFGRYMERVENIARIINVNSNLLFDLPAGTNIGWKILIEIVGSEQEFLQKYSNYDERSVMRHLISDPANPNSLVSSLNQARENARTTREILPTEAWERVNKLHLFVKESIADSLARKNRFFMLQETIAISQQLTGLLSSTMSNNHAYDFIRIGRNLERADMSTRIIDMGGANLLPHMLDNDKQSEAVKIYQSILWMHILISLSAYQMYRQHIQSRVTGFEVVRYIFSDEEFPRAVTHCLNEIQSCLNKLPRGTKLKKDIQGINQKINDVNVDKLLKKGLSNFIDRLQIDLAALHNRIAANWFE